MRTLRLWAIMNRLADRIDRAADDLLCDNDENERCMDMLVENPEWECCNPCLVRIDLEAIADELRAGAGTAG